METPINPAVSNKDDLIRNKKPTTGPEIFQGYLSHDQKLTMEEFGDIYSAEEIKKDRERVEYVKMSKDYEKPTPHGIVLENLFCDLAEKHGWFGDGARIVQLSEFDDIIADGAHCDAVLEIPMSDGYVVRVGIDLTTAVNYDTLSKKRTKCLDGVKDGSLFSVKYFKSKVDNTRGKIKDMPVFFAGMDKETLAKLCESAADQKNKGGEILDKHEAQFIFMDEIISQLNGYIAYSQVKHGQEGSVTQWMDFYKEIFEWIRENKKSLRPDGFGKKALNDEVYRYITKYAS